MPVGVVVIALVGVVIVVASFFVMLVVEISNRSSICGAKRRGAA